MLTSYVTLRIQVRLDSDLSSVLDSPRNAYRGSIAHRISVHSARRARGAEQKERGLSEAKERKSKRKGREVKGKGIEWSAYLLCIFSTVEEAAGPSEGITHACALEKFDNAIGIL